MPTTRQKFVKKFGKELAKQIEDAAQHHRSDSNVFIDMAVAIAGRQIKKAKDQFLLDIATCIAYECLTRFYENHGFKSNRESVQDWICKNVEIPDEYKDPAALRYYADYYDRLN